MAERRMFAKTILDSDAFLDMPLSSQCLYMHLSMRADDDGFINNPKKIQRMVGASDDDFKLLIAKNFIIPFESGIVVIKHWRIHNYIQKDRYKPTVYEDEKALISLKENGAYTLDTKCIQDGYRLETQVRLGKDSIDKDSIENRKRFVPPTVDEVRAYASEKGYKVDADRFVNFYESKNWMVGKNKMTNWKSALSGWASREKPEKPSNKYAFDFEQRNTDYDAILWENLRDEYRKG